MPLLRYLLSLLLSLGWCGAIALVPKYWGAFQDKRLSGPVLTGLLLSALAIWIIFVQLQKDRYRSPLGMIRQWVIYGVQYALAIALICGISWVLSLGSFWLLSPWVDISVVNGISVLLFVGFIAGIFKSLGRFYPLNS